MGPGGDSRGTLKVVRGPFYLVEYPNRDFGIPSSFLAILVSLSGVPEKNGKTCCY
jgi:hypothetical protein